MNWKTEKFLVQGNKIATKLQTNTLNVSRVILIVAYAFITFIFTSMSEDLNHSTVMPIYHSVEFIFIVLFVAEIIVFKYAFKEMYFSWKLNVLNTLMTWLIIIFWGLDIFIKNYSISILLRTRGCFRLFYIPVIFEQINSHNKKNKGNFFDDNVSSYDKPSFEQIVEVLLKISEIIEDSRIYNDLHFWIKHISAGKIYENEQTNVQEDEIKSIRKRRGAIHQMEEHAWIRSCSNVFKLKRDSNDSGTIVMSVAQNKSLESLLNFKYNFTQTMESLDTLEFDIFEFREMTQNRELTSLTSLLLQKHSLYSGLLINVNKFIQFMDKVASGYNYNVKYHNATHAADVWQTLYYFIMNGNWISNAKMDNIDIWSMILGAAVHDYEHPGFNNMYLINTKDTLAIRYNDVSVLENHHVASAHALMKLEKYNILGKLWEDDRDGIRRRMIHMVLTTDMSKHFAELGQFKQRVASESFEPDDKDKLLCMGLGMHLADISNPTKPWDLTLRWTELLFEEFFKQGDKEREKKLKISDLMDRTTVNIARAQLGFIDVIVLPAFESFSKFIKWWNQNIKNMKTNRANWESRIGEYQDRMVGDLQKVVTKNEIIEEAKSESEESSESNKLSSFQDSSQVDWTMTEIIDNEKKDLNLSKSKQSDMDSLI